MFIDCRQQPLSLLQAHLASHNGWRLVCFCAQWCNTCNDYVTDFVKWATAHPEVLCAWVDIEMHPDILGDIDIENFPTLLLQNAQGKTVFFGPQLPHVQHVDRLVAHADSLPVLSMPADLQQLLAQGV